jgi:hypothetical protein
LIGLKRKQGTGSDDVKNWVEYFVFLGLAISLVAGTPRPYEGEFPFVKNLRKRSLVAKIPRVLVLPVVSDPELHLFSRRAERQISEFFRKYNYVVPSALETRLYLEEQSLKSEKIEQGFKSLARKYRAKYIVLLRLKSLLHKKKANIAGLIAARSLPRAAITGAGREAHGEFILKVFSARTAKIYETSAVARKKDHMLGFWRSSKQLARRLQDETIASLLEEFALRKIHRSKGYILTPIKTYHPDSKGFQ